MDDQRAIHLSDVERPARPRDGPQVATPSILSSWALAQREPTRQGLYSVSSLRSLNVGVGDAIIFSIVQYIIQRRPLELVIVTCFWAESASLNSIHHLLRFLSAHALSVGKKIRIRICVSSLSLLQKLIQTSSGAGHIFAPEEYVSKLHLPSPRELPGLDMQVKSVFLRPFSVMHSKFILIDHRVCLMPSCNISWEDWFEGCAEFRGPIVQQLYDYYESCWERGDPDFSLNTRTDSQIVARSHFPDSTNLAYVPSSSNGVASSTRDSSDDISSRANPSPPASNPFLDDPILRSADAPKHNLTIQFHTNPIPTLLLPHPPNRNPRFRPFPCQSGPDPPSSPLNDCLLHLFATAHETIFLRTPNLTAMPVITALLNAVERGVDVHVITNRKMMVLEQLVTAGTTSARCIGKMLRQYNRMQQRRRRGDLEGAAARLEAGRPGLGDLRVEWYDMPPRLGGIERSERIARVDGAVKSHFKCTIVDGRVVVLGSGNMDRASWFTSQEIGVAVEDVTGEVGRRIGELVGWRGAAARDIA